MLTLITGVPGSGKTALVVEMILEKLKEGRKIYALGIPDLVAHHKIPDPSMPDGYRYFCVEDAGNPLTWQKGSWLKIKTYDPKDLPEEDFDSVNDMNLSSSWADNENADFTKTEVVKEWVDDFDKETGEIKPVLKEIEKVVPDPYPDVGSLIIIDEAQTYFRPRSSSAPVPDYVKAFEVHRHQGLDFWLLTQRPALLDSNIKGLISRHIHIRTTAFGRKKYEWAECQNPDSIQARTIANTSSYKPNPKVFALYSSAQQHTKLKVKLPNGVWILIALFVALCLVVSFLYFSFSKQLKPKVPIPQQHQQIEQIEQMQPKKLEQGQQLQPFNPIYETKKMGESSDLKPINHLSYVDKSVEFRPFRVTGLINLGGSRVVCYLKDFFSDFTYEIQPVISMGFYYYQDKKILLDHIVYLHSDDYLVFSDYVPKNSQQNDFSQFQNASFNN